MEGDHGESVRGTGRPVKLGLPVLPGPDHHELEHETLDALPPLGPPMAVGEAIEIRHASLRGAHTMPHPDTLTRAGYVPLGVVDRRYHSILMWRPAKEV
jgi:hypothetical protein